MKNEGDNEDKQENKKEKDIEEEEKQEDKKEGEIKKEENDEDIHKQIEETKEVGQEDNKENKQLKKIFFVIGILVLFFLGIFFTINSMDRFTYKNVDFYVEKYCDSGPPCLTVYRTSLPVNSEHKITGKAVFADYNFYFRNDPRKLKDIPVNIDGKFTLMRNLVANFTGSFNCDGDGIIAIANLVNVLEVLDVEAIKDETAGCDPDGRYTFLQLQAGNETSIEQFGSSCYNLNINNCEILEVTEKYIVELLSEVTKNKLS